jgi:hypothetical protein
MVGSCCSPHDGGGEIIGDLDKNSFESKDQNFGFIIGRT